MDFVSSVVQETLKMEKTVYCLQECTDDSTLLKTHRLRGGSGWGASHFLLSNRIYFVQRIPTPEPTGDGEVSSL